MFTSRNILRSLREEASEALQNDKIKLLSAPIDPKSTFEERRDLRSAREHAINQLMFDDFLQAVIDYDEATMHKLLRKAPLLLIMDPARFNTFSPRTIECTLTKQRFIAENPLMMAIRLGRVHAVILMQQYFKLLQHMDPANDLAEVIAAGKDYIEGFLINHAERKITNCKEEYQLSITALIEVLADETFPHGKASYAKLSDASEHALQAFRQQLQPEVAVEINNYPKIESLLDFAYLAINSNSKIVKNRNALSVCQNRVIGFLTHLNTVEEQVKQLKILHTRMPGLNMTCSNSLGVGFSGSSFGVFDLQDRHSQPIAAPAPASNLLLSYNVGD